MDSSLSSSRYNGTIKCYYPWVSDLLFFLSRARLSPFWTDRIKEIEGWKCTSISSEHQCIEARGRKWAMGPARAAAWWLDLESSWLHCASLALQSEDLLWVLQSGALSTMTTRCHGAERSGLTQWSVQMGCYPASWMRQRRKSRWATSGLMAPQLCALTQSPASSILLSLGSLIWQWWESTLTWVLCG